MQGTQYRKIDIALRVHAIGGTQERSYIPRMRDGGIERRREFHFLAEHLDADTVVDLQAKFWGGLGQKRYIVFQIPEIAGLRGC